MSSKILAVTGSGGFFAKSLIQKLSLGNDFRIVAFSSNPNALHFEGKNVLVVSNDEIEDTFSEQKIDFLLHFAFGRRFRPISEIASSIDFSARVYKAATVGKVGKVINISSQSVYESSVDYKDETSRVAPDSLYSMAKYASEVLLRNICAKNQWVNLRFDSIAQSQRLLPALVKQAKENHLINLEGGKQMFSYIDIDDAAEALISYLKSNNAKRNVYNVGVNRTRYSLVDLAKIVKQQTEDAGFGPVEMSLKENETSLWAGIDSSLFMQDTGWRPCVTIEQTIKKMLQD